MPRHGDETARNARFFDDLFTGCGRGEARASDASTATVTSPPQWCIGVRKAMSADKVRRLLGSLLDDPENEKAWINLEERAISGELQELGEELPFMLAESRLMFAERGEAEAVLRVLDVEVELTPEPGAKARLLRERARVAEEEVLQLLALVQFGMPDPNEALPVQLIVPKLSTVRLGPVPL